MGINNVFRELPVADGTKPHHLTTMIRWWVENFQRIAVNAGSTADTALDGTTGHVHDGRNGQGPPVSAVSNNVVTAGGSTVWHAGNDSTLVRTTAARTISAQHTFSITGGGAPFVVSTNNTTLVSNLNADQLDGIEGSAFVRTTVAATISAQHAFSVTGGGAPFTVSTNNTSVITNLNADQLDGNDSTLFVQSTASTSVRHASTEVDIGNIAANSMATFTVSISGSVGSTVVLGPPSGIEAGLIWAGYVNAADTVTVRVLNSTASDINPASGTWNVTLIRRV